MAYRRRHGITRSSTFKEEIHYRTDEEKANAGRNSYLSSSSSSSSSSLAAQAIKASAAHRESSLSSAYGDTTFDRNRSKVFGAYEETSIKDGSRAGFWGVLAQKAKSILDDDFASQQLEPSARSRWQMSETSTGGQQQLHQVTESNRRMDNPKFRKSLDAITSSLNQIGDTFEKAFEEGRTIVENKTADIKHQIRRKGNISEAENQPSGVSSSLQQPSIQPTHLQNQRNPETQLKASRDVAMATAAKAKLLLRELKTVKADLAFAKQRCAQLEEENKILRESREKGVNLADDDLIRLQLETLLAEKARLAHENEVYARENRFLREVVEYHQLTMQDVVYIDEGIEEVTEVYPIPSVSRVLSISPPSPSSPPSPEIPPSDSPSETKEILPVVHQQPDKDCASGENVPAALNPSAPDVDDGKEEGERHSTSSSEKNVPATSATSVPVAEDEKDCKRP